MNETNYSIDEVKLMAKVKRYKRRWKEQRNYSEYLKCKLAKKALQVQKLKEQVKTLQAIKSGWDVLDDLESENAALRPYRDGYDPLIDVPKGTKTVIVEIKDGLVLGVYDIVSKRWYAKQGLQSEIRNPIRWWDLPEPSGRRCRND